MGDGQSPSLQSRTEWPEAAEDSTSRVSQGSVELKMPEMDEVSLPGQAGLCWSQGCGGLQHGVSFYFFLRKLKHVYTRYMCPGANVFLCTWRPEATHGGWASNTIHLVAL